MFYVLEFLSIATKENGEKFFISDNGQEEECSL
jgi:hypothetical protein